MPYSDPALHFRSVVICAERAKARVFLLLGNECWRCRCSDSRVLQIDHVRQYSGVRKASHRSGTGLYYAILNGKVSVSECQLLCANCNVIKRIVMGEHQRSKRNPTKDRYSRYVFVRPGTLGESDSATEAIPAVDCVA